MAERGRFELPEACASAVFKTAALNHSTISPHIGYGNITLKIKKSSFFIRKNLLFLRIVLEYLLVIFIREVKMSQEAVVLFYRELEQNPELRTSALGLQGKYSDQDEVIDAFIELGKANGYVFSRQELIEYIFVHGTPEK